MAIYMEPMTGIEPVNLFLTKEALYLLSYMGPKKQLVPERKWPFSPISTSNKNFNPQNTNVCLWLKFLFSLTLTKNSHFRSGTNKFFIYGNLKKRSGAGDEARTRDIQLGRLKLYQPELLPQDIVLYNS
jgi:hypothetical protein